MSTTTYVFGFVFSWFRGWSMTLALLGLAAPARADVAEFLGKRITEVRLSLEGRDTTDPALIDIVETRVGEPLSMADVRETEAHLFSLGRFEDVQVNATHDGAGVALRYELKPVHPVDKIEFEGVHGVPGIDEGRLRRAVIDRYGVSPPRGRSFEMSRLVEETLRESGYLDASVTPRSDARQTADRGTLILSVKPGARTRLGTIDVAAPPDVRAADILAALKLATGLPYEKDALDARIDRYVEDRRRHGFYEARVSVTPRLSDDHQTANLVISVAPGPHVRVVFAGDPLPRERRDDLVPIEREGSANEDLLEDSSNRIEEYLRGEGYREAVAPHSRQETNGELVITFTVKKGPLFRVQRVEISGNASVPLTEFEPALRLRDGLPFSDARLDADASTIDTVYRRTGFAQAQTKTAVERVSSDGEQSPIQRLLVRITVAEGVRTVVGSVRIEGNQSVPEPELREGLGVQPGQPFFLPQLIADRDRIQLAYANRGYQTAVVEAAPQFSAGNERADVVFTVREGPRITIDHVLIVGNVRTSANTIMRAVQIQPGDPMSTSAIVDAQQRLAALGLFRRVRLTELRHGADATRDLLVTVEEAPPTSVAVGGGGELRARVVQSGEPGGFATEKLEFAPRASFQVGRRNLWGKNRSIDLFTSVSLHPRDSPVFANQPAAPSNSAFGFTEYRVIGQYREPRLFDTTADAFLTATFEQQIRSSFNFARRGFSAGLARRITRDVSITGNYQIQRTRLFDEAIDPANQLDIDRLFPQILLSSFSASVIRDRRDDALDPRNGTYVSASGQLAARAIGSQFGFAKSFFMAQVFRPVAGAGRLVFAGDARLGLAVGFPRELQTLNDRSEVVTESVADLPLSERYFAGGNTTVRGWALDRLGVHHTPADPNDTIDQAGFPKGGNALIILNGELRQPLKWGLTAVGFLDAGNVFARVSTLDVTEIRGAAGLGIRWRSPVGPLRFDWGYKLRPDDLVPGRSEIWVSFGQAF